MDLYSLSSSFPFLQDAVCLLREMFLVFCLECFFLFILLRTLDHPRLREGWGRSREAVFVPLGPPVGGAVLMRGGGPSVDRLPLGRRAEWPWWSQNARRKPAGSAVSVSY